MKIAEIMPSSGRIGGAIYQSFQAMSQIGGNGLKRETASGVRLIYGERHVRALIRQLNRAI